MIKVLLLQETVKEAAETGKPGVTRIPELPLKGIRNLVSKRTKNQWPRGLIVPDTNRYQSIPIDSA